MRQFFLETDPDHLPRPGDLVALDREESHHLFTVLRDRGEGTVALVDGRGHRLTAKLAGKEGKAARLEILEVDLDPEEFRVPRLVLACAVVKGKRFEWVLEKAVELGAHEVVPLITEFSVVDPRPGKQERWRALMSAAVKQSGRSWLPVLTEPLTIGQVCSRRSGDPLLFGALPDDSCRTGEYFGVGLDVAHEKSAFLTLLIGPEGGWSPGEREFLASTGARPIDLGPHVLRTETAAVVGLAVLQSLRGRLSAPGPVHGDP